MERLKIYCEFYYIFLFKQQILYLKICIQFKIIRSASDIVSGRYNARFYVFMIMFFIVVFYIYFWDSS